MGSVLMVYRVPDYDPTEPGIAGANYFGYGMFHMEHGGQRAGHLCDLVSFVVNEFKTLWLRAT
jgi:hypothetical protein